jgi:hypothetical protein
MCFSYGKCWSVGVPSVDVELSNKDHEWQRLPAIEFIWAFDFRGTIDEIRNVKVKKAKI